ncbi:hypothetical protein [Halostagnicola bangensis]
MSYDTLATGCARGWKPAMVLALGNCCASYSVENETTGDRCELLTSLERTTDLSQANCSERKLAERRYSAGAGNDAFPGALPHRHRMRVEVAVATSIATQWFR